MPWPNRERGGGAVLAQYRQAAGFAAKAWVVRRVPICSSTEPLLSHWLSQKPLSDHPRALIAGRQTRAVGQWNRRWFSPFGGLWMSVAMPWVAQSPVSAGLIGLALAVSMAERLERRGLTIQIKWPNDLLVDGRKLAGLLPRLIHRGPRLRLVRIGVGLNVGNSVPHEGIALRQLLGAGHGSPEFWGGELLLALDRCLSMALDQRWCLPEAERRLWCDWVKDPVDGRIWDIEGIAADGALLLRHGFQTSRWLRWP